MMNKRRQKHPQFLKLIGSPSTVNHKGYQVTVSLKAVAEAGEAILGPEPTLDFLFYFRFTPVFLSVAIMGCTHKFDYVFFIYSILHQYLEIEINGKKIFLSFQVYAARLLTVNPWSTSEEQQEVPTHVKSSAHLLLTDWGRAVISHDEMADD